MGCHTAPQGVDHEGKDASPNGCDRLDRGPSLIAIAPVSANGACKLVKSIDLPGDMGQGGPRAWTTFDVARGRVWVSQSPDHNVVVINTATKVSARKFVFLSDVTVVVDKQTKLLGNASLQT